MSTQSLILSGMKKMGIRLQATGQRLGLADQGGDMSAGCNAGLVVC